MTAKKTVLLVDDDPDVLAQMEVVLAAAGYRVLLAGGQKEAEDLMLAARPDLAVVDLMMEHMDSGFVLAHDLKRVHPGLPVILLTGVTASTGIAFDDPAGKAGQWLKVDRILNKPVRPEQLREQVQALIG